LDEIQDPIPCIRCLDFEVIPQAKDCKTDMSSLICNRCYGEMETAEEIAKFKENYIKNEAKKWKELPLETLEMLIGFYKYGE